MIVGSYLALRYVFLKGTRLINIDFRNYCLLHACQTSCIPNVFVCMSMFICMSVAVFVEYS